MVEVAARALSVRYRVAEFSDFSQVAALEARNGLATKTQTEWVHLWQSNPAYAKTKSWAIGWVCENEQSEIVGSLGNVPLIYELNGREILTATSRALVADHAYRGYMFPIIRRFIRQPGAELIVDATSNSNSTPLHKACRFLPVPAGNWRKSTFWITNHKGFLVSSLKKKHLPSSIRYLISPYSHVRELFFRKPSSGSHELQVCKGFDERFEEFWIRLKQAHPQQLLANRSQKTLAWHFHYSLAQDETWIVAANDGASLAAYAVFQRQDNPEVDLKRVRLVDYQDLDGSCRFLESMLHWGLEQCSLREIHMLEAFGFAEKKQRVIDKFVPYTRELPSWLFYYKTINPTLAPALTQPDVWDPCHYDGDASL